MSHDEKVRAIIESPYFDVFVLVAAEATRSAGLHQPWSEGNHTPEAMHKLTLAELTEADAAIALGYFTDTVREFVHTANAACKAATELIRRGEL